MKLTLREKISISVTRDKLEKIILNPLYWDLFVNKIKKISQNGDKYVGILEMGSNTVNFDGIICDKRDDMIIFEIRFMDYKTNTEQKFLVEYKWIQKESRMQIVETVSFDKEFNIFLWLMIKVLARFGRPEDKSNLEYLKETLNENNQAQRVDTSESTSPVR